MTPLTIHLANLAPEYLFEHRLKCELRHTAIKWRALVALAFFVGVFVGAAIGSIIK